MRANNFGENPNFQKSTINFLASAAKLYTKKTGFDWGGAFEFRATGGKEAEIQIIEAYLKGKYGPLQLKAGRSRDVIGLMDTTLSSGSFSMSGNTFGIPKIELAIPEYWELPILRGAIAIKGNFSFGWVGTTSIGEDIGHFLRSDITEVKSYLHQKSLYARFGLADAFVNVHAGFNHQVMYGNENKIFTNFDLSDVQSFIYALTGKTWYDNQGSNTKLGNHLGSIDLGITLQTNSFGRLFLYRQQFYDVGALAHGANLRDGLTGLSFQPSPSDRSFRLKKVLVEYLFTKNQAGELWSKLTPSGDEDYYNNFMYLQGWSYENRAIGNPLLTPKHEARTDLRSKKDQYFINNRVIAGNLGVILSIKRAEILVRGTYSANYGTYGTSSIGTSRNLIRFPIAPPYFEKVNQFSALTDVKLSLRNGWALHLACAFDSGKLLNNNFGALVGIRKQLVFFGK
ncbi:capsule assembly Wzi family protein [Dyadobacter sp. CY261]|uniref:capsule assembly Wzi family protein n=1 Tax=Dyadobacter sp. CY261 TaxID=2907203 RepID=UPI001F479AE3|nr:capsule assembly Wzi family protein [Dyadobacter sp. CY261]MCF0075135.1 capsule assembly Wzi family protein [Dyadobacter sp. CY261]